MSKVTLHHIVPVFPKAFTQDVNKAIQDARLVANETDLPQVVFEGHAYEWYGFMSLELWQRINDDNLCQVQIVKPHEEESIKKRQIVKQINEVELSLEQLAKLEEFLKTL